MIHYRGLPAELKYTGPADDATLGVFLGGVLVAYFHPDGFLVVPLLEGSLANKSTGKTAAHKKLEAAGVKIRTGPSLSVVRLSEPAEAATAAEVVSAAKADCERYNHLGKRNAKAKAGMVKGQTRRAGRPRMTEFARGERQ